VLPDHALEILESTSFDLGDGDIRARGFVVDMNAVFEDFVVTALREALGASPRTFPQNAHGRHLTLDEAGRIKLEPDISWWNGAVCQFIGDVKYKKSRGDRGQNPDVYQVLSYVVAADVPSGLLIYAKGEEHPGVHRVRHLGRSIEIAALDLSAPPEGVLRQIGEIARRIQGSRQVA
jgi:5-methylcytosine-specific restriction enzyme subunit McrC